MNLPVSALMAVCPLVAAVILVHRAEGSAGVKRLLRRVLNYRRIGWRWYLPIVFLNPAILLGSYGVMRCLGWPLPDPQVSLAAAPLLLLVFLPPAVGEEAGWMGYAADPLQDRWGALRAGVLLGTVGALWHVVPLVQAHHDMAWIAWKCLETLAARVLIVTTLAGEAGATLWRNQVAPRGLLQMRRYRPVLDAARLRAALLVCVAIDDTETPEAMTRELADRAPHGTLRRYPGTHFDFYTDPSVRDRALADQLGFLHEHLQISPRVG